MARPRVKINLVENANLSGNFSVKIKSNHFPDRSDFKMPPKIVIIYYDETDFTSFKQELIKTGVIDEKYRWILQDGHLVIFGGQFPSQQRTIESLWLIYALEVKAMEKGGVVHFLLGRQDIEEINGEWRMKQPQYALNSLKYKSRYAVLFDGNLELYRWIKTKNVIVKIGSYLFVNGGLTLDVLKLDVSLDTLNNTFRSSYQMNIIPNDINVSANKNCDPLLAQDRFEHNICLNRLKIKNIVICCTENTIYDTKEFGDEITIRYLSPWKVFDYNSFSIIVQ